MVINYYGKASIRLSFGDIVLALNPISKGADSKSNWFGADIALASLNDPIFNGTQDMTAGGKEPFEIVGPGEYELAGVFIRGYESKGPKNKINTVYTVVLEGMKVCHLGVLAANDLSTEVIEEISGSDILFVPLGAEETVSPKEAAKITRSLIPKLVIPILYHEDEKGTILSDFMKEIGASKTEPLAKLSLKKKDLENKEAEVVILQLS